MPDIDEDELFNSAVSDDPADPPADLPSDPPADPQDDPPGDPPADVAPPDGKTPVDDNAPLVPSWRLREINEEKRRTAEENERLKFELAQARQAAPKVDAPKPEKVNKPDPLLDPDGYEQYLEKRFEERLAGERERMLNEKRDESLLRARETNQQEFDEAYKAAQQAVDPALKARMQSSRDPGKTLLEWHRENKVKAEVGTDPNAWLEKKLEERLKDPAFLAKAVELARGSAQAQPTQQSNGRPRVELPPSLTNASRSNAALQADNNEMSDRELFNQIAG